MNEPADQPSLDDVIAEFLQLTEQDAEPQREDFLNKYPQHRSELEDFFRLHDQRRFG